VQETSSDHRVLQREFYDSHYAKRTEAVRDQLAHPLFRSYHDRLAGRILDLALGPDATTAFGHAAGLNRSYRVFEPGCGEGFVGAGISRVAAERGIKVEYTGTDISASALELARPTLGDDLIVGDALEVTAGLPTASRDLVVMKNLLHHLDNPADLLREAGRVAGAEGRVAVVEARLTSPPALVFNCLAPKREKYFFKGQRRHLEAFRQAGLRVVGHEQFSFFPYELFFHIRPSFFRKALSTDNPRTIDRVSAWDDKLAAVLSPISSYWIWVTAAA
jgi:SAM-dependent methyltransferase